MHVGALGGRGQCWGQESWSEQMGSKPGPQEGGAVGQVKAREGIFPAEGAACTQALGDRARPGGQRTEGAVHVAGSRAEAGHRGGW